MVKATGAAEQPKRTQGAAEAEILRYLPESAVISDMGRHVVRSDLDGDAQLETVVFYNRPKDSRSETVILVLRKVGPAYVTLWEDINDLSAAFGDPTGIYHLNGTSIPQILAYRTVGASCAGIFDVYQFQHGSIEKITGDWRDGGNCQANCKIEDLNRDGVYELIFEDVRYRTSPAIYSWDKDHYVRRDDSFPEYYGPYLARLLKGIQGEDPVPASAVVDWVEQAVQIYRLQHRYGAAIELCERTIQDLKNSKRIVPNNVIRDTDPEDRKSKILELFKQEKSEARSTMYSLLEQLRANNVNEDSKRKKP